MQALLDAITALPAIPSDACRIFHGRGGLYPGCEHWTLDYFAPVWVLTSFQPVSEIEIGTLQSALAQRQQALSPEQPELNLIYQCRQEGDNTETRLLSGSVPSPHIVSEAGTRYQVHVSRGQNHGLFLDMAEGRRWVREFCAQFHAANPRGGAKVLNLFAYTCAFSVVALQGGASKVLNLDMSAGALSIGKQNHALNNVGAEAMGKASFLPHDIFTTWGKISRGGPYDLIIVDPPSFQKGSFVASKDYARLMRRLPDLLMPGGHALLCLNTPKLGLSFLTEQMSELAPDLVLVERLANPPAFADVDEDRALKVLLYRAPALA